MVWKFYTFKKAVKQARNYHKTYMNFLSKNNRPYYIYDKDLGWTINSNASHNSLSSTSNKYGFRNTSLPGQKIENLPTISIWGDSLAEGTAAFVSVKYVDGIISAASDQHLATGAKGQALFRRVGARKLSRQGVLSNQVPHDNTPISNST